MLQAQGKEARLESHRLHQRRGNSLGDQTLSSHTGEREISLRPWPTLVPWMDTSSGFAFVGVEIVDGFTPQLCSLG